MIKGLIQRHNKALNQTPKQGDFRLFFFFFLDFRLLSTELYSVIVQASMLTVTMWLSVTDRLLSVCSAFFFFFLASFFVYALSF